MILCKQNSAPLRVAKQKMGRAAEGGVRPQPFEGYVAISGAFAVKGVVREGVQAAALLDGRLSLMVYQ